MDIKKYTLWTILIPLNFFFCPSAFSAQKFQNALVQNQVLSVIYGFWSGLETENQKLEYKLERLVNKGLNINTLGNKTTSHAQIIKRAKNPSNGQKNSHEFKNFKITNVSPKGIQFEADITYLRKLKGKTDGHHLHYDGLMVKKGNELPQIKNLDIRLVRKFQPKKFIDNYRKNRISSFVHYWFSNFDRNDRNPNLISELVVKNHLEMNFSFKKITRLDQLVAWVKSIPTRVKDSAHHVKNINFKKLKKNTYEVTLDLNFQRIDLKNQLSEFKVAHRWVIQDDDTTRYPKIIKYTPKIIQ